jgi:hypothetical protein
MRRIAWTLVLVCFLPSLADSTGMASSSDESKKPLYRHAYYLFLSGTPNGCEDCYVPLLVTQESLDQSSRASGKTASLVIITYERDSIWRNDGIILIDPTDIETPPRVLHLRGRKYRYQEISSAEALKLFENPLGATPISRMTLPVFGSSSPTLDDLISSFRKLN